ncbi:MAG: mandelate racemase/muconate lactonizing enzyme family protein [Acidobacteriaceae bacterium]
MLNFPESLRDSPSRIQCVEAFVLRSPILTPVVTSFGTMSDRPALFVRIVDGDGIEGWGEIWCNFPSVAAEYRAALVSSVFTPMLVGMEVGHPADLFTKLTLASAVLALQAGEPGPFAQVIAGLDLALWDLRARRAGVALWRLLGGESDLVKVYASGVNPVGAEALVATKIQQGFAAFKLKVGFGREQDISSVRSISELVGTERGLMVDANQAWDYESACLMSTELGRFRIGWLEEPVRSDRPLSEWQALARRSPLPLAAGENLVGEGAFAAAIASHAFAVVQPDAAKWGGISGCLPVIRAIVRAGLTYCPHFLGGGVGLLASAHLLAAAGGDGMLEVDANANPLRSMLCNSIESPVQGRVRLGDAPGIGVTPDIRTLRRHIQEAA